MRWTNFVWMDGKLVEWKKAKIHISVGALHYGICIFEGIRAYITEENLNVFRLKEHVERMYNSAKIYQMNIPFEKEAMQNAIIETIRCNEVKDDCYIRPIVYRGELPSLGVKQTFNAPVNVSLLVGLRKRMIKTKSFEEGKKAIISSWRRISSDAMPLKSKCAANYANSALAIMDAIRALADYPIFLDSRGFVCEGPGQNLFIIKSKKLITPPLSSPILAGITRDTIIKLAQELGYNLIEEDMTRDELYTADEVFLCGTSCEIAPIVEIDGAPITNGVGKITARIASYYLDVVTGKVPKYRSWVTTVYE